MSIRKRRRQKEKGTPELNITAFLNLMVVLIPFLLLSAAFSHITILDLYLPQESETVGEPEKESLLPRLEVIIRSDRLQLIDRSKNISLADLPYLPGTELPLETVQQRLLTIKQQFPAVTSITLLAEETTSYDQIIQVMDRVRNAVIDDNGMQKRIELFPDIGIGDAPKRVTSGTTK